MVEQALTTVEKRFRFDGRHLLAVILGALFAIALYQIWDLQGRWFYVIVIAIVMVSVTMVLIGIFSDFLMVGLFFAIPIAGFGKWFMPGNLRSAVWSSPEHNATLLGVIGVGPVDIIVAGLYVSWFARIFILREEKLPRLNRIDIFVIIMVLAYIISIPGSFKPNLGFHATFYLLKFVALYFYVSRNFQARHIPWFIFSLVCVIALETALSAVQHFAGLLLGLGLDKGSGTATDYQYMVPGTEGWTRATGTLYDSHTLGLYMAMLSPFMFVLAFARFGKPLLNITFGASMMLSLAIIVVTFTRSAWVASAVSMSLAIFLTLFVWRQKEIIPFLIIAFFILLITAPWSLDLIIERFDRAPAGTINVRFEGYEVAMYLWSKFPLFGSGAGNFLETLYQYNYGWNQDVVVHNTILLLGVETGIVGVIGFYGITMVASWRLWKLGRTPKTLVTRLAFASMIALVAMAVEGMATPMHREPTSYAMIWFLFALGVALPRIHKEQQDAV